MLRSRTLFLSKDIICSKFSMLARIHQIKGDPFRERSYLSVVQSLKALPLEDITASSQVKGIYGIGTGMLQKIQELVDTGTLNEYDTLMSNKEILAMLELGRVHGFGPKIVKELVTKKNIYTIEELKKQQSSLSLTHAQILGIKYFNDSQIRIPRDEITYIRDHIMQVTHKAVDPNLVFTICGSYRRNSATSGDVDILVTNNNNNTQEGTLERIVSSLQTDGIVIAVIGYGPTKFMGYCKLPEDAEKTNSFPKPFLARRIDIRWVDPKSYWSSLLYFTGSDNFNIEMRQHALEKGFTLNEYGIVPVEKTEATSSDKKKTKKKTKNKTDLNTKYLDVRSEEDIFKILGLSYQAPETRSCLLKKEN